jgi:hypothetical protein
MATSVAGRLDQSFGNIPLDPLLETKIRCSVSKPGTGAAQQADQCDPVVDLGSDRRFRGVHPVPEIHGLQTTLLTWTAVFVLVWIVLWNSAILPLDILPLAVPWSLVEIFLGALIAKKVQPKPST